MFPIIFVLYSNMNNIAMKILLLEFFIRVFLVYILLIEYLLYGLLDFNWLCISNVSRIIILLDSIIYVLELFWHSIPVAN